jgi:hypothetical protein
MNKKNAFLSTSELEKYITGLYSKIFAEAVADGFAYRQPPIAFTASERDGGGCYSDDDGYHYRYFERGRLFKHEVTEDLSEITFITLDSPVFYLAQKYEVKHRIKNQDFRRLLFAKYMQYFAIIGEEYKKKAEAGINKVLEEVPYKDE